MTIKDAQDRVDNWIREYGVRYFSELTNTALLMEEVGEFSRLVARVHGEQSFKNTRDADNATEKMADEMADILFVLICLANQMHINLESAFLANLKKKTDRDQNRHTGNPKLA